MDDKDEDDSSNASSNNHQKINKIKYCGRVNKEWARRLFLTKKIKTILSFFVALCVQ